MLRKAIASIPDENFHICEGKWYYSLTLYHIIETIDFYSRATPEGMKWGSRGGFDWKLAEDVKTDVLGKLSKEMINVYLDDMESRLNNLFKQTENLFDRDEFDWFDSAFQKLVYLLRHSQHHIGELAFAIRKLGMEPLRWK